MASREADRQAQLLEIARRLFAQQGFAGTSLRDIATEAGITKAALYHHFPNKEALYDKVVLDGMRALFETAEAAVGRASTPIEKIRGFLSASAEYFQSRRHQWVASSNAFWQAQDLDKRSAAVQVRDAYEGLLRRCVAEGIASGELRPELDPALTGKLLLSALNQLPRWHKPDGRMSARQVMERFVDMTLFGIAQPRATAARAPAGKQAAPEHPAHETH